jgi:predicted permease
LIVAMHVAAGVSLGPWLLVRWSEGHDVTYSVRDVFRQPLVWSPLIGLLGRGLPDAVRVPVLAGIAPLAAAAAPVALFLLGLYIALHWRSVHPREPSLWGHVLTRLFVAPVLATLVVVPLMLWAGLAAQDATLVVLFAATPIAVTTLVLSAHVGVGMASIAGAIVVSTVVALATLPVAIRAALQLSALLGGG